MLNKLELPGAQAHEGAARLFAMVMFYAVLANIPYWIASYTFGFERNGVFSLDYILVGLVALFVPRLLVPALLFLAILIDAANGVSRTFLLPLKECLSGMGAVHQFSALRQLGMLALIALALFVAALAARIPDRSIKKHRMRAAMCLAVAAALLMAADVSVSFFLTGHAPSSFQFAARTDAQVVSHGQSLHVRVVRSPTKQLVFLERMAGELHTQWNDAQTRPLPSASAAERAIASAKIASGEFNGQMPNVVLILVESWGLDMDAAVRQALVAPYQDQGIQNRYQVVEGTVPFFGSTVVGEGRELCGSRIGFHLLTASREELENCLPDRLDGMGYHTTALHGGNKLTFLRQFWYGAIGFQEELFDGQFKRQGLPDCEGAFIGTCDSSIADWIRGRLDKHSARPSFIYWVTLNSHLPVPSPVDSAATCSFSSALTELPAYCSWYQLVANVHHAVSAVAETKLARPTVFAIVGDHMPPFGDPDERSQFSSDQVPFVLLVPRAGAHTN